MKTSILRGLAGVVACASLSWIAPAEADAVSEWNALAVQCISTARPGAPGLFDLAIVQAAVHDAVQAIEHKYEPYLAVPAATGMESRSAAAASAAYHVLYSVCPTSLAVLDAAYKPYLDGNDPGLAVGQAAATTLLAERRGTPVLPPFTGGTGLGEWRPTPPGNLPMAFFFIAADTEPFTLQAPSQFRPGPPPTLGSHAYLRDYNEVKALGAIGSHPSGPACPAPSKTDMARFWSGNFISQWNEAVRLIALDEQLSIGDNARLLALVNLAAADSAIAVWNSKVHYNYWRPITAIREGANDLNNATVGDPGWTPFIQSGHFAPGSQTPNYPDYVSGANGITGAVIATLQLYFRTDWFPFEVYKATPATMAICTNPRSFNRFSDAAQEVVDARIWQGIHFRFADTEGRKLGSRVAIWTYTKYLRPRK